MYDIVHADDWDQLVTLVNDRIAFGWEPLGPPLIREIVSFGEIGYDYHQAVTKRSSEAARLRREHLEK